ncbi:hypothetical protein ACQP00_37050 [Dactylosporangium sp. CS-047395]
MPRSIGVPFKDDEASDESVATVGFAEVVVEAAAVSGFLKSLSSL